MKNSLWQQMVGREGEATSPSLSVASFLLFSRGDLSRPGRSPSRHYPFDDVDICRGPCLLQPSKDSDRFSELVTFMSHVAPCYKSETAEFGPQLKSLLEQHGPVLVRKHGWFGPYALHSSDGTVGRKPHRYPSLSCGQSSHDVLIETCTVEGILLAFT